jgi:hypothetical protein
VQPYVALGKLLVADGHRVRIASHETFRSFVKDAGLEFFDIGGNPQDLMSYMVKSEFIQSCLHFDVLLKIVDPGLMPGITSLTNGDISRKRKMLTEVWVHISRLNRTDQKFPDDQRMLACVSFPVPGNRAHICSGRDHFQSAGFCTCSLRRGPWNPTFIEF